MTTQGKQLQPLFPDFPTHTPVLDNNGDFSEIWNLSFTSLFQALQNNFKQEGIVFPALNIDQINAIQALYTPYIGLPLPQTVSPNRTQISLADISGQTVFDTTNRVPKQFIITFDNSSPPNVLSASWLQINVMLFSTVDPNGTLAGNVGWFCYNIGIGKTLYICIASGSKVTAVWQPI
jgi:hypothetical protein